MEIERMNNQSIHSLLSAAPTKEQWYMPSWDLFGINNTGQDINCVACVAALFWSLQDGLVHHVSQVSEHISLGDFQSHDAALKFIERKTKVHFERQRSSACFSSPALLETGSYLLVFELPATGNRHAVWATVDRTGGTISVYDPQGNYWMSAQALRFVMSRKPVFHKATNVDCQVESAIPEEAQIMLESLFDEQTSEKISPKTEFELKSAEIRQAIEDGNLTIIDCTSSIEYLAQLWLCSRTATLADFATFLNKRKGFSQQLCMVSIVH